MKKYVVLTKKEWSFDIETCKEINRLKLSLLRVTKETKKEIEAVPEQELFFAWSNGICRRDLAKALRGIAYRIQHGDKE